MNDPSLFSAHWFRVKALQPKLAADVQASLQIFRGVSTHLLHRGSSKDYHRLDSMAYELVSRFDGETSVEVVWEHAQETHGIDAPTQPEFLHLLTTLHEADLVVIDRKLDAERLFKRGETHTRRASLQRLANPLYLRFNICDPHRWLAWAAPKAKPFFTRTAFTIWLIGLLLAFVQLAPQFDKLATETAGLDLFSAAYLLAFLSVYAVMKLAHELAHAVTLTHFGGEVREFGVALMVLVPNPYTDASSATFLASKYQRMLVSAAGIIVELAFASFGALLWSLSDGLLRELALIMLLTGSVSTLLFNGNPLLKFDGYHVLADWLEIPDLAERSRSFLLSKTGRLFLRLPDKTIRIADARERQWLTVYGVTSTAFRVVLMLSIAWMLSDRYFFFGVLIALYVMVTLLVLPTCRLVSFINSLPPDVRWRSTTLSGVMVISAMVFLSVLPLPRSTLTEGVIWLPENAIVRVEQSCYITEVFSVTGIDVQSGVPLLRCEDPELITRLQNAQARVRELTAQKAGLATLDPMQYQIVDQKLQGAISELQFFKRYESKQLINSQAAGQFLIDDQQQLQGRYFEKGSVVAYVVPSHERTVRVLLSQDEIGLINKQTDSIEIAMLHDSKKHFRFISELVHQTPKPNRKVVSPALTKLGGGRLAATEQDNGIALNEPAFDVELRWPKSAPNAHVGSKVHVKFSHHPTPLINRITSGIQHALIGRNST